VENIMTRSKRLPVYVAADAGVSALVVVGVTLSLSASGTAAVSSSPPSTVVATRGTDLGQTGGQGLSEFGGRWYVLSPAGTAVLKAPDSSKQGGSTGTYGY
jgi:hypothetical protein